MVTIDDKDSQGGPSRLVPGYTMSSSGSSQNGSVLPPKNTSKSRVETAISKTIDRDPYFPKIRLSSSSKDVDDSASKQDPDLPTNVIPEKEKLDKSPKRRYSYARMPREAIIKYVGGKVSKGSMNYFFKYVLPPTRQEFDIDRIMKYCSENGIVTKKPRTRKYTWADISLGLMRGNADETKVYNQPLMNIFNAITDAALETWNGTSPKPKPSCYLYANDDEAPWSMKGSDIKPDAQMFLMSSNDTYPKKYEGRHWYNAALSFHYKKSLKDAHKNIVQVLHSLHHPMVIDPCRRFTLGVTIESTRMRLWMYNRSIIICSDYFDFNSNPRTLIKVVLSLVFADKVDLGWDPTINAKYEGKRRLFDFEIAGKRYKTNSENLISEHKVDGIYTSATRIYKAFGVNDKDEKEPVVIKDFWPTEKSETEDIVQQKIHDDITDPTERELFRDMTLTPIASERVKVDELDDHTEMTILRGASPDDVLSINSQSKKVRRKGPSERIHHFHRRHYRIVYKEYATPYHDLRNLDDMLLVLVCAVKVLLVIHKAGWIHRDLSPGNLYLYTDPSTGQKRGLVGDLEYAKKAGIGDKPDGQAGTPDFMAVEIMMQDYQFEPLKRRCVGGVSKDIFDDILTALDTGQFGASKGVKEGIWANYLHDIESIWWIMVWTLFTYQDASKAKSTDAEYKQMLENQDYNGKLLFSGTMNYQLRSSFLSNNGKFGDFMNNTPKYLAVLKVIIVTLRDALLDYYTTEEAKEHDAIKLTDGGSLHNGILSILDRVPRRNIEVVTISDWDIDRDEEEHSKRTLDDDDEPAKKQRSSKAPIKPGPKAVFFAMDQNLDKNPGKETGEIMPRSERGKQIHTINRSRGPQANSNARNPAGEGLSSIIPDWNRRMTRSMTRKTSKAVTSTIEARVTRSKTKHASTKS